jgi:hypothetical protein
LTVLRSPWQNDHRNIFPWCDVETRLEKRQVLIEIEPNAKIGKFTGKKVVPSTHGSGTYSAVLEERQDSFEIDP